MLIALPSCQGRLSPVFDVAARLLLVRIKDEVEVERKEIVLFEKQPDAIVRDLRELEVHVLICGAISQGLQTAIEQARIRVVAQVCGEIEAVIAAYRSGKLNHPEFVMPGCSRRRCDGTHANHDQMRPGRGGRLRYLKR